MPRLRTVIALLFAALLVPTAIATSASANQGGVPNDNATFGQSHKNVCPDTGQADVAHCDSQVVTKKDGVTPAATATYSSGYGPVDLQSAYNLGGPTGASATAGSGKTVAVVDAYDQPNIAADLATYRAQWGPAAGTLTKVDQNGGSSYPSANASWGQEISLDVDMVSAICPNCNILLVEANSASFSDLTTAVDTAARLGADAISNSYGGNEFSSETLSTYDSHYNKPGRAVTVSSGDNGYGVEFPAASEYVTAVGGTHLTQSSTGVWSETAWSGAGSGCSKYVTKQSWQSIISSSTCSRRAVADVSAVADPYTGVAVYDSYGSTSGWMVFGGTSVASPIIASVYALAGNTASISNGSYPYSHRSGLNDITKGSNGHCRWTPSLCTAGTGWDGPTGLGTPNGTSAF